MKIFHNETEILDIAVDDNSYRYRAIRGDHSLTLYFSLAEHVEIPVGAHCVYQGETYTLEKPESLRMEHSRKFVYTVVFESPQAKAGKWKFRNPADRRLKFSLTATPREHLQMLVDNMNQRDGGWTVGRCIDAPEKTLSYNHAYCMDALAQMADAWETEYEFNGRQVSLWKVEYDRDNPLPLSYGRGNGFLPGIGRSNYSDSTPVEILYVQGGTQNLAPAKYGSPELLLPKNRKIRFDGVHFEGEDGFDVFHAVTYTTDADGFSIRRAAKPLTSAAEDSLDLSDIYPKRIGTIGSVVAVDAAKHFYDIIDKEIPAALNYGDCLIEGETLTILFQSGMLAGREFEVKYVHDARGGKAARRFEIVPQEIDGMTMPGGEFIPQVGDTYAVFHCMLPEAYICDNATRSGASWDMFREGVKYLYDNERQKFSVAGELDGVWAKRDWNNIGGRIRLGGFVQFSDERFQPEGVLVRIVGIKDFVNNPHSPEIELSNTTVGRTVSGALRKIESNEVVVEEKHREALQFTKRRYRDSMETIAMLGDALLNDFSHSINPVAVQTMAMMVGDRSLQFEFVDNMTVPTPVAHEVSYDAASKVLTVAAGIIRHMTLGIDTISSSHAPGEYKHWSLPAFSTPPLTDGEKRYYLYAKVGRTERSGTFYISETAIGLESVAGCYHLLLGVLNSEYAGERSYVSLHGFTEVMPGQVMTNRIATADGRSFIDFLHNALHLGNDSCYLDWNSKVADTLSTINMLLENATIKERLEVLGEAFLAGFLFSNELIKSEKRTGDNPALTIDGKNGYVELNSTEDVYTESNGSRNLNKSITLSSDAGRVETRNEDGDTAYMSTQGVFANKAGINPLPPSAGIQMQTAIAGLGHGKMDKEAWGDKWCICGVYGDALNLSAKPTPAYGGFFRKLRANGLYFNVRRISASVTLNLEDTYVSCCNTEDINIYLPADPYPGMVLIFKRMNGGNFLLFGNGKDIHTDGNHYSMVWGKDGVGDSIIVIYDGQYWNYNYWIR